MSTTVCYRYLETPLGRLLLVGDGPFLTGLYTAEHKRIAGPVAAWQHSDDAFAAAVEQLEDYFAGRRQAFDLPLRPKGTPFQQRVWQELMQIPFGRTITYAELAERVGNPAASRAVGNANGRNPISIIVPCHRVIGADGKLTGYAGGVEMKRRLVEWERSIVVAAADPLPAVACSTGR
jgi:methylated-DNA-[protein]-cysteine S-methyltransferase